jgi:hypothetical protein
MSKTRGAAGTAVATTTEARHESDARPRQGDPLEQVIEPAAQPIVSEGSPSMHAMERREIERGDRPGVYDASAAADDAIAARAYELYQARGGTHGADIDDWLQAEQQLRAERQRRADSGQADRGPSYEQDNPAHRPID